jgi:phosphoribosyl 1,2-cyclic phosphodiesterase
MLLKSNRPKILKDRIRGDYGHLSNADSAAFLSCLVGPKTKAIYLAHLSEECNTPDKALSTQRRILEERGVDLGRVKVVLTNQWKEVLGGDWAI